jgi:hypothetical protein
MGADGKRELALPALQKPGGDLETVFTLGQAGFVGNFSTLAARSGQRGSTLLRSLTGMKKRAPVDCSQRGALRGQRTFRNYLELVELLVLLLVELFL